MNRLDPDGLAAPKFMFSPRDPGRAVGIRAIVTVDGQELTTDPIELRLTSGAESKSSLGGDPGALARKSRASSSSSGQVRDKAALSCPTKGASVPAMGTINGSVCYLNLQYAQGQFGQQTALATTYYLAAEGIYQISGVNSAIYVPPDLANLSLSVGMGCLPGDGDGVITADFIAKLRGLSISFGVLVYNFGFTTFTIPGQGPVRGLQHDSGIGVSLGGILGFVPVNFSYSIQVEPPPDRTMAAPMARFVRPWNEGDACAAPPGDENALEYASARLQELEGASDGSLQGELSVELAANARPLFDSVSNSGFGRPAPEVPAASNGDFYAEFLSHSGTEPLDGSVNTSADGLQSAFVDASRQAGESPSALLAAASSTVGQLNRSLPSLIGEAALLARAQTSLQAGDELTELAEMRVPEGQRFIAPQIRRIVVQAGEPVHVELTAQEVADLVSRPFADVVGATVHVETGGTSEGATFPLSAEGLAIDINVQRDSLLVRFDVDLSTAAGNFPPDVADWVVRPALVSIRVEPGPAAAAFVAGPPSLPSGAPASLSVQVLDAEGRLVQRPCSVRFVDSEGRDLGSTESERGTALLQFVPEASVPRVDTVTETSINYRGDTYPGLSIMGASFSEDLEVALDGAAPLLADTDYQVQGPEEVLVILPPSIEPGSHTVTVRNPEGVASPPRSFLVSEH